MSKKELADAARDYMAAVEAMHTMHSSTDVHGLGGIAGQAITPHCAYTCNDTGGRVERTPEGGIRVIKGTPPHAKERAELERATNALLVYLERERKEREG